jgi:hypothetical protein
MNELHATINSIASGIAILGVLWIAAVKLTRLEVKVETMWGMLLKRAIVEGVSQSLMEVHSPVRLINNSGEMLIHMADEIREFYKKNCQGMSESAAALAIEKEFGSRLVTEVCIPNNISFGICLIIALSVAKGDESLTEILDNALPLNKRAPIIRHE